MSDNQKSAPADAPPSYAMATGSSTSSKPASSNLQVPGSSQGGIPSSYRRSMEDEHRPLPEGWLRQYDAKEQHHFYVDTKANPPRSIWHHPYDDEQFLGTLSSEERERIQEEERQNLVYNPSDADSAQKHGTSGVASHSTGGSSFPQDLPPRASASSATGSGGKTSLSERLKSKVTGMTKEERQRERQEREKAEREYYEMHVRFRNALQQAQITGQPQYFATDHDGKDVYIEPPNAYGGGYRNGYGYNPYQSGPYSNPNARFIRPQMAYGRPGMYGGMYGRPGYGGSGMGLPIAAGALGGLALGGLLF